MPSTKTLSGVTKIVELNGKKMLMLEVPADTPEGQYQTQAISVTHMGPTTGNPVEASGCIVDAECGKFTVSTCDTKKKIVFRV